MHILFSLLDIQRLLGYEEDSIQADQMATLQLRPLASVTLATEVEVHREIL